MMLTCITGAILPVQAAVNARLSKTVGSPVVAALISFLVGTAVLLLFILVKRQPMSWQGLRGAPIWMFTGGLIGAFYVAIVTFITPTLGGALTFALVITGQLIAALLLDHFGWLGLPVQHITPGRVVGVILLLVGIILIRRY